MYQSSLGLLKLFQLFLIAKKLAFGCLGRTYFNKMLFDEQL